MEKYSFDTKAIHAGHEGFSPDSMSIPIYQSVAYPYQDAKEAAEIFAGKKPGYTYGRWDNPTVNAFEKRMAALENTDAAIATSSGMAAIFLLGHLLCSSGDEFVSTNRVYGGTFSLLGPGFTKMGVKVNWVTEPDSIENWRNAITPKTKFIYVETPSNPGLYVADIKPLYDLAQEFKIPLVVDNTIATPALQTPTDFGKNIIVVHSTTKYICGNTTSLGGVICGTNAIVDGMRLGPMRYIGPSMAPMNAWLNLVSLEHLGLRMERHSSNALTLAKWLEAHPKVESVNYPGLESNQYHNLAKKHLRGFSSLLSFVLKGTYDDAVTVIDSLELWTHATHLGATKTIVTHPASTTHVAMGLDELKKAGISPSMIRVSVGLEAEKDIIADITQALDRI